MSRSILRRSDVQLVAAWLGYARIDQYTSKDKELHWGFFSSEDAKPYGRWWTDADFFFEINAKFVSEGFAPRLYSSIGEYEYQIGPWVRDAESVLRCTTYQYGCSSLEAAVATVVRYLQTKDKV